MSQRNRHVGEALYTFFSGFGVPAYAVGAVPNDAQLPYIAYERVTPAFMSAQPFYAEVFGRKSISLLELDELVDEIETAIGEGVSIPTGSGAVWIYKGDNFRQDRQFNGDPYYRCAYLNLIINAPTL